MTRTRRAPDDQQRIKEIGARLREVREAANLSREEFVNRLGRGTRRAIAIYEEGRVLIPSDIAYQVCEEFQVRFSWLMAGVGPMTAQDRHAQVRKEIGQGIATSVKRVIKHLLTQGGSIQPKYPDLQNPKHVLAIAVNVAWRHWERALPSDPDAYAAFLEDLLLTVENLLGHHRLMQKHPDIAAIFGVGHEMQIEIVDAFLKQRRKKARQ